MKYVYLGTRFKHEQGYYKGFSINTEVSRSILLEQEKKHELPFKSLEHYWIGPPDYEQEL